MKYTFIVFVIFLCTIGYCQETVTDEDKNIYNPNENAATEISKAVKEAKKEGKFVLIQVGGNWCVWCKAFDKKVNSTPSLKEARDKNFVVYHLNYSKENRNENVLSSLGFPQRFGFPVFVILDDTGNRIHTQNSAYLEEGKGHSEKKILQFFNHWSPMALDPNQYVNK